MQCMWCTQRCDAFVFFILQMEMFPFKLGSNVCLWVSLCVSVQNLKSALLSCIISNFTNTVYIIVPFITYHPSVLHKYFATKASLITPTWWSCKTNLLFSLTSPLPSFHYPFPSISFSLFCASLPPTNFFPSLSFSVGSIPLPPPDHLWGVEENKNKFNVQ